MSNSNNLSNWPLCAGSYDFGGLDDNNKLNKLICCRCYDFVDKLFPANCNHKPEELKNVGLGMYHCPDCGAMVLAGIKHPELCKLCIERKHPDFDGVTNE